MKKYTYTILVLIITYTMFISIGCSTNGCEDQQYIFSGAGEYWDVEVKATKTSPSTYRLTFLTKYLQDMSDLQEGQTLTIEYLWLPEDVVVMRNDMGSVVDIILPENLKSLSETKPIKLGLIHKSINSITETQLKENVFILYFDHTIDESIEEISEMAKTISLTIQWIGKQEDIELKNTGNL